MAVLFILKYISGLEVSNSVIAVSGNKTTDLPQTNFSYTPQITLKKQTNSTRFSCHFFMNLEELYPTVLTSVSLLSYSAHH